METATTPASLPLNEAESLAILALALVPLGRAAEALAASARALQILDELGGIDDGEAVIRLAHAGSLRAAGQARSRRRLHRPLGRGLTSARPASATRAYV